MCIHKHHTHAHTSHATHLHTRTTLTRHTHPNRSLTAPDTPDDAACVAGASGADRIAETCPCRPRGQTVSRGAGWPLGGPGRVFPHREHVCTCATARTALPGCLQRECHRLPWASQVWFIRETGGGEGGEGQEAAKKVRENWVKPCLAPLSQVTLGRLLCFPEPQFPHL